MSLVNKNIFELQLMKLHKASLHTMKLNYDLTISMVNTDKHKDQLTLHGYGEVEEMGERCGWVDVGLMEEWGG